MLNNKLVLNGTLTRDYKLVDNCSVLSLAIKINRDNSDKYDVFNITEYVPERMPSDEDLSNMKHNLTKGTHVIATCDIRKVFYNHRYHIAINIDNLKVPEVKMVNFKLDDSEKDEQLYNEVADTNQD